MTAVEKAHAAIQSEAARQIDIIKNASKSAVQLLASEAAEARKVAAAKESGDHDLLIELRKDIAYLRREIEELKNGNIKKIEALEIGKASKKEFELLSDEVHGVREIRMRTLENKTANFWIAMSLYSLLNIGLIGLIVAHIFKT